MAPTYTITADQGSTFLFTVTWTQPLTVDQANAGDTFGTPVDMTGYGARMQVRSAPGAPDLEIDASTANGMIVIGNPDPTDGSINVNVPALLMQNMAAASYKYDLDIYSPAATPIVTRLVQGQFKVSAEITVLPGSLLP